MNLTEWCHYLEAVHPAEMELTLDRVRTVADRLKLLPVTVPVFMVAGTNGKGTTTAFLDYCLRQLGYEVGTYTSPHLLAINERFSINGQPISDDALCQAFATIEQARGELLLTFFEFCVLAALYRFRRCYVDILVLEVGLGGRLDAVNIVDANVSIITNIALDHQSWLGDTRDAIGREKAGVCRRHQWSVCGDPNPPNGLLAEIDLIGAQHIQRDKEFSIQQEKERWHWQGLGQHYQNLPMPNIPIQNAATAMAALQCLPMLDKQLTCALWEDALENVAVSGRYQCLSVPESVILDVAHNPQAAEYLCQQLQMTPISGKTHVLFSALADKDIPGIIAAMLPVVDSWSYAPLLCSRAASLTDLAAALPPSAQAYDGVLSACQTMVSQLTTGDRLVVFGSFFTVSAVLPWLVSKQSEMT